MRLRIGPVQLKTNVLLAPVAGYFDLPYRLVVRSVPGVGCEPADLGGALDCGDGTYGGVGLCSSELLCGHAIVRETDRTAWLAETDPLDRPLAMQLYGADADVLAEAGRWAVAHGAAVVDLNMGCPVDKVTKRNGGSMLLRDACNATSLAARVVDAVAAASGGRVAVTAKIRLGWDDTSLVHQTLPPRLADVGVAAVTVHGRTTAQRFKPSVRMAGIAQTVEAVKRRHPGVAVIGNGDIQCGGDAEAMVRQTGCDGVMLARGAMGRPWLGREVACRLATGRDGPPLPRLERARLVRSHFENLLRLRGEREAMHQIRFRVARYSPHLQPWPGLRRDVRSLQDAATFRAFWAAGMDRIAGGEHAQRGEVAVAA